MEIGKWEIVMKRCEGQERRTPGFERDLLLRKVIDGKTWRLRQRPNAPADRCQVIEKETRWLTLLGCSTSLSSFSTCRITLGVEWANSQKGDACCSATSE